MIEISRLAFWVLIAGFALSLAYELYRATLRAGVSQYDSMPIFVKQGAPFYALAIGLDALLLTGATWAVWVNLLSVGGLFAFAVAAYGPVRLPARKPGFLDWFETYAFVGLLSVAGALLVLDLLGATLAP